MKPTDKRFRHGHARAGQRTTEWNAYVNAKMRCQNPKDPRYPTYGARGIQFLFTSFGQFFTALGRRPKNLVLDRLDNDGNYEPGNVQWTTRKQSALNTTRTGLNAGPRGRLQKVLK